MRSGPDLYAWVASLPVAERDVAIEHALGLDVSVSSAPPGDDLVGHHMIGVAAVVRAIHAIPIRPDDVVLDLGSGLGKFALLVHLFTGARVRGVEIQAELVALAPELDGITYECGDARMASLDDATVVVLHCPFSGDALADVSRHLDAMAFHPRGVVVGALGLDLRCERLRPRPTDDFWSTIWDSGTAREAAAMTSIAHVIAHERFDRGLAGDPAMGHQ